MSDFIDSFSRSFTPAYLQGHRSWQDQQNADREFGLKKRQADQQAQLTGMQIDSARGVADARTGLQGAVQYGLPSGAGGGAGTTEPEMLPASEGQMLGLRKNLAIASGQDIAPLLTEGKRLTAREKAAARAKDPAYMEQVIGQFNLDGAQPMTIADVMDPKTNKPTGYRQLHLVDPKTGKASKFDLSPDDARRVVYARELIEAGMDDEGHAALKGVNADLAARIKALNDSSDRAVSSGNQAANFADDARHRKEQLGLSKGQLVLAQQRGARESKQDKMFDEGIRLGKEAAVYARGLSTSQSMGAKGAEGRATYGSLLAGTNAQLAALGIKPFTPGGREQMTQVQELKARAELAQAGYKPEQIESMITGYDPAAAMMEGFKALQAKKDAEAKGAPANSTPGPTPWERAKALGIKPPPASVNHQLGPNYSNMFYGR